MVINDSLKKVCTARELEYVEAYQSSGTMKKAAEKLNVSHQTVKNTFGIIKNKVAVLEPSIESVTKLIKDNPNIKGVSDMQTNNQGKPVWIKYKESQLDSMRLAQQFIDGLKSDLPKYTPKAVAADTNKDLLSLYTITDYHLGMLADAEETGGKWNIKRAEQMLLDWFNATMEKSPNSEQAVFLQLGDFLHWDGLKAVTPGHGHVLDADSRYQKLIRSCIRVMRQIVDMLLSKHKKLHLIFAEGNHDESGSAWMREFLAVFYEDEKRITIDTSIDPYYAFKFGKVGIYGHHQHKKRIDSLPETFAAKFRHIMFSCEYNYGHCGHLHHRKQLESSLMVMTQHQTMSAPDAHSSGGGWLSKRGATVSVYHKDYGFMTEHNTTPAMLGYTEAPMQIYTLG